MYHTTHRMLWGLNTIAENLRILFLSSFLWKFWSRRLSRSGGWRRELKCAIVQLKWRADVHAWTLRWLHDHPPFTIRKLQNGFYISMRIHVDGCATFGIKELIQPLSCSGLLRRTLPISSL